MKHLLFAFSLVFLSHPVLFSQAGTLDPTFGVGGLVSTDPSATPASTAWGAEVAEDGKILIGGNSNLPFIVRYLPDGKRDTSFANNGMLLYPKFLPSDMKALPGGKILLIGEKIARLNADGSEDPSCNGALPFGAQLVSDCVLQQDGKFLVALSGSTAPLNQYCIARYLEDGSLDLSFGQGGLAYNDSEWSGMANDMTVQPDGKILVTGNNGKEKLSMARYLSNGTPDLGFGENGMLVWGDTMAMPPEWYLASGGDTIGEYPHAAKTLVQPDGRILVAVQVSVFDSLSSFGWVKQLDLFRLNPDGSVDSTFGVNGLSTLTDLQMVFDIFLQSDGKIQIAGGTDFNEVLLQVLPEGIIDPNFETIYFTGNRGNDQGILDFAQQPDGKIIAALSIRWSQPMAAFPFFLHATRLLVEGSTDESFGGHNADPGWVSDSPKLSSDETKGIAIQPDGKILVFGSISYYSFGQYNYNWSSSPFVKRLNQDGSIDPTWWISKTSVPLSFIYPATTNVDFHGVAAHLDGKTTLAYSRFALNIARFKTTAKIDSTFGGDGNVNLPSNWSYVGLAVQPDGKVLVAATVTGGSTVVIRLLANGDMDTAFGLAGTVDLGQIGKCKGFTLLPNGKIAIAGNGGKLVQLTAEGQFDPAFSNDGLAEFPLTIHSIAAQPNGQIVLGVGTDEISIARISADGNGLDVTFSDGMGVLSFPTNGNAAFCKSIAIQPDGKIVATGNRADGNLILVRCTAAGKVDSTFGDMGQTLTNFGYNYNAPTNVAIQPNGKIVVGAEIKQLTGRRVGILRYLSGLTVGTDNAQLPQTASMAFPNPFSNALRLDFSSLPTPVSSVDVFAMSGRQVFQAKDFTDQKLDIPESNNWTPGVYLLRATTASGVFVQKMVKQ